MTKEEIENLEGEAEKYFALCGQFPDNPEYKETLQTLTARLRRVYEDENANDLHADKKRVAETKAAAELPHVVEFESKHVEDMSEEERVELNELAARFHSDNSPENRFNLSNFIGRISTKNAAEKADVPAPKNIIRFPVKCK